MNEVVPSTGPVPYHKTWMLEFLQKTQEHFVRFERYLRTHTNNYEYRSRVYLHGHNTWPQIHRSTGWKEISISRLVLVISLQLTRQLMQRTTSLLMTLLPWPSLTNQHFCLIQSDLRFENVFAALKTLNEHLGWLPMKRRYKGMQFQ